MVQNVTVAARISWPACHIITALNGSSGSGHNYEREKDEEEEESETEERKNAGKIHLA